MLLNEMKENLYDSIINKLISNGIGKCIEINASEKSYLKDNFVINDLLFNIRKHFNNLNLYFVFDNKNNIYIIKAI